MRNDLARTISTVAIWASIAAILISFRVRGPEHVVVNVTVGMTGFLSVAAAFATCAIWRPSPASEPIKYAPREL